jgi:hypothetical protein
MSGLLGANNHHSLLPPSGRTSSSGSHNACIHKSSIHCSSSHFSFPLLDYFLVSSYQAGSLVILDTMIGCSVFSPFLGIFMFFLMFLFSFLDP